MANTVFANEVIGSKIKDILTTSVDLKNFMTIVLIKTLTADLITFQKKNV